VEHIAGSAHNNKYQKKGLISRGNAGKLSILTGLARTANRKVRAAVRRRAERARAAEFEALTFDPAKVDEKYIGSNKKGDFSLQDKESVDDLKDEIISARGTVSHTVKDFDGAPVTVHVEEGLASALKVRGIDIKSVIDRALGEHAVRGEIPDEIVISSLDTSYSFSILVRSF